MENFLRFPPKLNRLRKEFFSSRGYVPGENSIITDIENILRLFDRDKYSRDAYFAKAGMVSVGGYYRANIA